jgi:23S rRNA (adenine2503-C2)-methyltransferase
MSTAAVEQAKINLLGLNLDSMKTFFHELGEKPFRALQIIKWIHQSKVDNFAAMTDLSVALRNKLQAIACIQAPEIFSSHTATDGTCKWILRVDNANLVEAVYIPEKNRGTLCISSQVGCSLNCTFCSTAKQGFNRNLTTAEIIGQLWIASKQYKITNVVMMGMGEPLLNYDNVLPALSLMRMDDAYGISRRKVTVSTSGVVPRILDLARDADVSLAVSLHAPNDKLRTELVPINKKYPIKELLAACNYYLASKTYRRHSITMEYVMLHDVNDKIEHAKELVRTLKDIPSKVNLIPFNPYPNTIYTRSSDQKIQAFANILSNAGMIATIRKTRGNDITAACGQLVGEVKDRTKRSAWFKVQVKQEGHDVCYQ